MIVNHSNDIAVNFSSQFFVGFSFCMMAILDCTLHLKQTCVLAVIGTVAPRYNAPRYYADSDITRSVVDPDFLPPGENAKWACLNLLRIALTILKKH